MDPDEPDTIDPAEARRLDVLAALHIMDTPPEREFDTIVECAQRLLGCKIALLTLIDGTRLWFKAKRGLAESEVPRPLSMCTHALHGKDLLIVPDTAQDPRFADNPLVQAAGIRFYAGMPIRVADPAGGDASFAMGTVCVTDDKPRRLSDDEADMLRKLGHLAQSLLSARALAEERRIALHHLDVKHRQFRQAERIANIGSWRLTLDDNITEWSDQVYTIHGLPQGVQPHLDEALTFYPPHDRARIAAALADTIATGAPFGVEADFVTARGQERRIRTMGELEVRDGIPVAVLGVFQDITGRYRMEQALRRDASHDDLTGLANRARFNEVLASAMTQARKTGGTLALALIDLDHFKAINDTHGHQAGDAVLQHVAERLRADYLTDACAARLGGDEFVLLFTERETLADLDGVLARLSDDLIQSCGEGDDRITVSATIGAAWLGDGADDRSALLHRADMALYAAKRARRGTVRIDSGDMPGARSAHG